MLRKEFPVKIKLLKVQNLYVLRVDASIHKYIKSMQKFPVPSDVQSSEHHTDCLFRFRNSLYTLRIICAKSVIIFLIIMSEYKSIHATLLMFNLGQIAAKTQ